jgi:hypothetical protein
MTEEWRIWNGFLLQLFYGFVILSALKENRFRMLLQNLKGEAKKRKIYGSCTGV